MSQFRDRVPLRRCSGIAVLLAGVLAVAPLAQASAADHPERQKIFAATGAADAKFGTSVAISGDTAVAGAPDEGGTPEEGGGMGAAYLFTRGDGIWTERATLVAPVRTDGDKFGFGVAVDGDTVVVGAPSADEAQPGPGVAYVFVRSGETWPLQATLTPADSKPADLFGFKVAIDGDTVVVGAPSDQGSTYVFTRTGDVWSQQAKLTALEGAAGDSFGSAVAISGDTVVIGASAGDLEGSAYVFERDGESWAQQAKLISPSGDPVDQFGRSVAVTADTVAVGAHFDDDGGPLSDGGGSVYVFKKVTDAWSEPTKLAESGAELLGVSVAMSGHTVIAGANFTKVGTNASQGAAYVYSFRPPTQVVGIDVKPGDTRNRIRTSSNEEIAVAVLGTPTFDATTIDPSSACFGDTPPPAGTTSYQQPSGADADCTEAHRRGHVQDVDGDGDLDMVLHFESGQTGLDRNDTVAMLTGITTAGGPFAGTDSIRTVP